MNSVYTIIPLLKLNKPEQHPNEKNPMFQLFYSRYHTVTHRPLSSNKFHFIYTTYTIIMALKNPNPAVGFLTIILYKQVSSFTSNFSGSALTLLEPSTSLTPH